MWSSLTDSWAMESSGSSFGRCWSKISHQKMFPGSTSICQVDFFCTCSKTVPLNNSIGMGNYWQKWYRYCADSICMVQFSCLLCQEPIKICLVFLCKNFIHFSVLVAKLYSMRVLRLGGLCLKDPATFKWGDRWHNPIGGWFVRKPYSNRIIQVWN